MNPREQGFLLLASSLGAPHRKPLTPAQLRSLSQRAQRPAPPITERALQPEDLIAIGCDFLTADHIIKLLEDTALLEDYLSKAATQDCYPITRISPDYPNRLRLRLSPDAPAVLWAKGDPAFLQTPMLCLVGSRELLPENHCFAAEFGRQAALQGFTLVSGNARGADRTAQESCLAHGGRVISIVADSLAKCPLQRNILYLSEESFDAPFSAQRALSRNRIIHALGMAAFVAQVRPYKGGTWSGTVQNLKHRWSPVYCFFDGSAGADALQQNGAVGIEIESLQDFPSLLSK